MHKHLIGKEIEFTAYRIQKGNPVTGVLISEDKESIVIELTKYIEGLVTYWEAGAEREFKKSLIDNIKLKTT